MNRYEIKQQLGQGNFGIVYRVIRKSDKKEFALKKVNNRVNKELLSNEIKIYGLLKQSNVENAVKCQQIFSESNYQYFVMQLCRNGTLQDLLKKYGKLQESISGIIIYFITKGINQLHKNNITHRDLKPANILFDSDYFPMLNDFGLSKYVGSLSPLMKSRVGTPLFMSPQILQYQQYTIQADTWSIGVMMYLMIFGRYPFYEQGDSEVTLKKKINKFKINWSGSQISQGGKQLILKCLQQQQQCRISSEKILQSSYMSKIKNNEKQSRQQLNNFFNNNPDYQKLKQKKSILNTIVKFINEKNQNIRHLIHKLTSYNILDSIIQPYLQILLFQYQINIQPTLFINHHTQINIKYHKFINKISHPKFNISSYQIPSKTSIDLLYFNLIQQFFKYNLQHKSQSEQHKKILSQLLKQLLTFNNQKIIINVNSKLQWKQQEFLNIDTFQFTDKLTILQIDLKEQSAMNQNSRRRIQGILNLLKL